MHTPSRRFKDAIYEQFARIGKAVGSPRRLELLDLLCQGPRTVEALAAQVGQSLANTSHHLQVLRAARLVKAEKKGVFVTYCLADDEVCAFFLALRALAESRLAEIDAVTQEFLASRDDVETVGRAALVERVKRGDVTVIDVRPVEEYRAGHVPGAISLPLDELERRLSELDQDREIVAYCRGPYCVLAVEAVAALRRHGFTAIRSDVSVQEWRRHGHAIQAAAATLG